jgi:hypothetical protein
MSNPLIEASAEFLSLDTSTKQTVDNSDYLKLLSLSDFKELSEEDQEVYLFAVEQLQEISKKTLGSYINKASSNLGDTKLLSLYKVDRAQRDARNRQTGIDRAVKRLTKEEYDNLSEEIVEYGSDGTPQFFEDHRSRSITHAKKSKDPNLSDRKKMAHEIASIHHRQAYNHFLKASAMGPGRNAEEKAHRDMLIQSGRSNAKLASDIEKKEKIHADD